MRHVKWWKSVIAFILILAIAGLVMGPTRETSAGSEPEPSPTPPADWVEFFDRNRLFSIRYPQHWFVSKEEVVVISPSEHTGTNLSVLPDDPLLVIIPQGSFFPEAASPQEALQLWLDALRSNWDEPTVDVESGMQIGGQAADMAHVSATDHRTGIAFEMNLIAFKLADGDGLIIAIAPQDLWDGAWPTMHTMLDTLRLLMPEEADNVSTVSQASPSSWQDMELGTEGGPGQLSKPQAIAVGPNGELYVLDTDTHRIQVYSAQGVFLFAFGEPGTYLGQFDFTPQGALTVDADRNIYVVDPGNWRIQKLDPQGDSAQMIGTETLSAPRDVAVSSNGQIYVTDGESRKIHVFDRQGRPVKQLDLQTGQEPTGTPQGIAVGPEGHLYVTVPTDQSLLVLDDRGEVQMTIGRQSSEASILAWPTAVAVDESGNIYVADTELGQVKQFDPQGQLVATFAQTEFGEPIRPTDLALDRNGNLYACDAEGRRVLRLLLQGGDQAGLQLTNGDFEYGLAAWQTPQPQARTTGGEQAYVYEDDTPRGHVLELKRTDEEGDTGTVNVFQPLDLSVRGLDSLCLMAQVMVITEEGNNIGGPNGNQAPEGAVLLRLFYRDTEGHDGEWYHGFYSKYVPDNDTSHFTTVPLEKWYPYKSDDLLTVIPQMDTITGLQIYGVGQTFTGRVDDVQFVAK